MNDAAKGFLIPLGLALVVALGLALVLAAAALPIRAWRRRDPTGETHHYHEGMRTVVKETRVLDSRVAEPPKLYPLPLQPAGAFFPELMRAAYRAGLGEQPVNLGQYDTLLSGR